MSYGRDPPPRLPPSTLFRCQKKTQLYVTHNRWPVKEAKQRGSRRLLTAFRSYQLSLWPDRLVCSPSKTQTPPNIHTCRSKRRVSVHVTDPRALSFGQNSLIVIHTETHTHIHNLIHKAICTATPEMDRSPCDDPRLEQNGSLSAHTCLPLNHSSVSAWLGVIVP